MEKVERKNNFRIEYTKGDTYALKIIFKNITTDLTTAIFSVKENYEDETALVEKTIGAGISKVDGTTLLTYKLQLQAEDSRYLQAEHLYLYDLKIAVGNVIKTIIKGNFIVTYNVTSVDRIETELVEIEVDDVIESELETTPATEGIEYEQDPVAMAKIGDITELETTANNNLVDAINEVNTKAVASLEEITKIEDGTVTVPEATHASSADNATNASNSAKVNNVEIAKDQNGVLIIDNIVMAQENTLWTGSISTNSGDNPAYKKVVDSTTLLNKKLKIYYKDRNVIDSCIINMSANDVVGSKYLYGFMRVVQSYFDRFDFLLHLTIKSDGLYMQAVNHWWDSATNSVDDVGYNGLEIFKVCEIIE